MSMISMTISPQVCVLVPAELCWGISLLNWVTPKMSQNCLIFYLRAPTGMRQWTEHRTYSPMILELNQGPPLTSCMALLLP